jgi:hypothetical protein
LLHVIRATSPLVTQHWLLGALSISVFLAIMSLIAVYISRQKSLDREARIPIQLNCFLPGFRLHRYSKSIRTSLQHHGALHKGARMHMDLDSGAAFPMTDKHYSLL